MSDYTPTTEDVAVCYMAAGALRTSRREHDALMEAGERYRPEFDRWLAEHDRQVSERVWDQATANDYAGAYADDDNPYRSVT